MNENRILAESSNLGENRILTQNRLQNHAELQTIQNQQNQQTISSQSDTQHLKGLNQYSSNNNARNNVLTNLQHIKITQNTMNYQTTQMHDNNMQNTQITSNTQNAQNTQSHTQMTNFPEIIQNQTQEQINHQQIHEALREQQLSAFIKHQR